MTLSRPQLNLLQQMKAENLMIKRTWSPLTYKFTMKLICEGRFTLDTIQPKVFNSLVKSYLQPLKQLDTQTYILNPEFKFEQI
jgi:hypothetical protein